MNKDTAWADIFGQRQLLPADPAAYIADLEARIKKALDFIVRYGSIDGAHHKTWVLDQATRALTGCPMELETIIQSGGEPYTCEVQGASHEYLDLVRKACEGEDGPNTYDWDEGIPP